MNQFARGREFAKRTRAMKAMRASELEPVYGYAAVAAGKDGQSLVGAALSKAGLEELLLSERSKYPGCEFVVFNVPVLCR